MGNAGTLKQAGADFDVDLVKSGSIARSSSAGRSGYLPVPLEHIHVGALAGLPVFLNTSTNGPARFTLYCGDSSRFTEAHRKRLLGAAVRFIYLPMSDHVKFRQQVEKELESIAADPETATSTKSALVYETSIELINEIFSEPGLAENLPRLQRVARSVSMLVMNDRDAFSHIFALAQHDFYTATHAVNVGTWMTALACAMGVSGAELETACTAGMLHDAGKMYVPDEILNKTGKLTESDWKHLREHPARGAQYLQDKGIADEMILRVAHEHHERLDGSGYPRNLTGESIHPMAKICAVVDSFDAMTALRPFKNKVKTVGEALAILQAETPGKYDAKIVGAWQELLKCPPESGSATTPAERRSQAQDNTGRRSFERFAIECEVVVHGLECTEGRWKEISVFEAKAHNISRSGIGLLCETSVDAARYLRVYVNGKGTLANRVFEGQVVHCRNYGDGVHEIGIRFCKPGEQEKASAKAVAMQDASKERK